MRVRFPLAASLIALALMTACGSSAVPPSASSGAPAGSAAPAANVQLIGAGSTADFPLFTKMFDDYGKATGVQVNYQSVGSGAGIQQLTKKTVDFGATDVPLTADQEKAAGAAVVHVPATILAVAVTYNVPQVKTLKLDGEALANIYLGSIKKWNDPAIGKLNEGVTLPATDIAVVNRSDGSGTTGIFTNYLSSVSPDWKSKVGAGTSVKWPVGIGGKGSEGLAGAVKNTPGSIGYIEYAYAVQNKIPTAVLKNQAGQFVAPSVEGATAAAAGAAASIPANGKALFVNAPGDSSYPIAGFSWVVAYKDQSDPTKAKALTDLFTYMATKGQAFAQPLQYAPLPDQVVKVDQKLISTISAGK